MRGICLLLLWCLPAVALAQTPPKASQSPDHYQSATLQALNKVTARVTELEAKPNLPVSFGTIDIMVRSCWKSPEDEEPDHAALMEIRERKAQSASSSLIFSGWMFAKSPALSALEHPVYDITLIRCNL